MIPVINTMQRLAEPLLGPRLRHQWRGPAAGGKRASAQPLTPSTAGMLDGGEGASSTRPPQPCIGPFALGDQARRAQGSRGPAGQRNNPASPISSTTRVRITLDQHTTLCFSAGAMDATEENW